MKNVTFLNSRLVTGAILILTFVWICVITILFRKVSIDHVGDYLPYDENERDSFKPIYAIGDLHGDLQKTRQIFKAVKLIDGGNLYRGGKANIIQMGDMVGRGNSSFFLVQFFEALKYGWGVDASLSKKDAFFKGILVYNYMLDQQIFGVALRDRELISIVGSRKCRTLFVHAESLKCKGSPCEITNDIMGFSKKDSPITYRGYAKSHKKNTCDEVYKVLKFFGVQQMVVGHSSMPNNKIHTSCNDRLYFINIGISEAVKGEDWVIWKCWKDEISYIYGKDYA